MNGETAGMIGNNTFMEINLVFLTNILTHPPGNLIYHLVIIFALSLIGLLTIPKLNSEDAKNQARQTLTGCAILLIIQIVLFAASLMTSLSPFPASLIEVLCHTLTIIWLIWIFHEQDPEFFLTGVNIFLSLAFLIITTAILILAVLQQPEVFLDMNMVITSWQIGAIFLTALGMILIFIKRPPQYVIAVCILIVLAIGHTLEITQSTSNQFLNGAVRLAQTLSMPWAIVIVQRLSKSKAEAFESVHVNEKPAPELRVDTKPTLIDYLLKIPLQKTDQARYKAVARALSLSVLSDICCILQIDYEKETIDLLAGYDLIRETYLEPSSFSTDSLSHIFSTWQENRTLKLSQNFKGSTDIETLTNLINYPSLGNLFAYPLPSTSKPVAGGVILLSPYTEKNWGKETVALFDEIRPTLSQILFSPLNDEKLLTELPEKRQDIPELLKEKQALEVDLRQKETALQEMQTQLKQWKAKYQVEKLESMNRIERMQSQIEQLSVQVQDRGKSSSMLEQMEANIRHLTSERDQLRHELANAEARIETLKTETGQTGPIHLSVETEVVSLDSIIANARLRVASLLSASQNELEIVNPDGHQMIKTDPKLIQTLLFGLLDNAIKANGIKGKIQLSQTISFETGMLEIQVTDYGEGLNPEEQKSLFNGESIKISGIGSLQSIRQSIQAIRLLNGKIWLKSKKGVYTTFRVQLPVRIID